MHFFTKRAFYNIAKGNLNYDNILENLLNFQIIDIIENEDYFQVLAEPNYFFDIKNAIQSKNMPIIESGIDLLPNEVINISSDEILTKITRFIDACDNDDDIQSVTTNVVLP